MAITSWFFDASVIMTVVSFVTFLGILWWTFGAHRSGDFETAAQLPFADESTDADLQNSETHHV